MEENTELYKELQPGTALNGGKYVIEKKLGEGGFGITYKAVQQGLNRAVCIKEYFLAGRCVRNTYARTVHLQSISEEMFEKFRQAFVKEAQTLASFHHPNIVEVIDIFNENNTSYMVMPFIEGRSLQSIVENQGPLSYPDAVNYIAQITSAVGYIHDRHILHRDIKPENIMITADFKAILIDFGSAREFQQDKTQRHTSMLTRGYAPPEQYMADSRKGSYTDIYALGASLYFAMTGQVPIDAAARAIEELPEPKSINPNIPDEANRTIMKAMQLKVTDRYQTVQEFMDDLRNTSPSASKKSQQKPSQKSAQKTVVQKEVSSSDKTAVMEEGSEPAKGKKFPVKWLIVGAAAIVSLIVAVVVIVLLVAGNSNKNQLSSYDEAKSFYDRGEQAYQQGMSSTQGQLDKFNQALIMFDSAQYRQDPQFKESVYMDSIKEIRGKMYDYCLDEAQNNYSSAFHETGMRQYVLNYLRFAQLINDTKEVRTLIDSIQYKYIPED